MQSHQKVSLSIGLLFLAYVSLLFLIPVNEVTIKPNIFLLTSGVLPEIAVSLLLVVSAILNKQRQAIIFIGIVVFGSVLIGRLSGTLTNFQITTGQNIYT